MMISRSLFRSSAKSTLLRHSQFMDRQGKCLSAQSEQKIEECPSSSAAQNFQNARPFREIPGPSIFEFIRGFFPGGLYHDKSIEEMIKVNLAKYGEVFRMPGFFGKKDIIATVNPDDMPQIYRNEGTWPYRRTFEFVLYYRNTLRKDYYEDVEGLIWSNGEKWGKMRSAVNPILVNTKNVKLYLKSVQDASTEFVERIREVRDSETFEVPEDFENDILHLTFETVCSVALNRQLGLIRKNRNEPRAAEMMTCVRKFIIDSFDLEMLPPFWKIFKTRKFNEMMHTLDRLTFLCDSYIKEALEDIENDKDGLLSTEVGREKSVLEKLGKIDHKTAVVTAIDLMMAGVDTTSSALITILLCLSKNPEKQEKLFEEIKDVLPEKDSEFTLESLSNLPYLRACIKESMRLIPLGVATLRRMPKEIVLSGYQIPAGTDVLNASIGYHNHPDHVPRAKEFIPERWLRSEKNRDDLLGKLTKPFMFLPFGYGPRMCAGKRLADLELEINIARLVRNYQMEFNYPIDKAFKARFIITPQIPLKFTFKERND